MAKNRLSKYKQLLTGKKDDRDSQGSCGCDVLFTTPSYKSPIAIYSFLSNPKKTTLTVSCRGQLIGTLDLHSLSSKIDITLHGESFSPAKDSMSLSGRYNFAWQQQGTRSCLGK
jgi:hypothetical protein